MSRCIFAGALSLFLVSTSCASTPPAESAPLVGAWRSSIRFDSGAFAAIDDLQFMYVFDAGGTLTESSNYDGAPPVPPAYGVWRATGPDEFEAKYEFFSTGQPTPEALAKGAGWPPSGRGVLTERIRLSPDAQTFTSTLRYEAFDVRGAPIEGGGSARGRAVRIRF
jgi:hypothetical protein